jgi:hypothetical protein
MNTPEDKAKKPPLSRADIETIMRVGRERAALLYRLKEAILNGDSLLERQLAREIVGLPKEVAQ